MSDNCVFIHTNERQWLGALVAEYSFRRNSANADKFDVQFIHTRDYPYLRARDCLLYTSPSPRDRTRSRMPSSA